MENINDFYNSILNIRVSNEKETETLIKRITKEKKAEVKEISPELDGFCKYLASQIQEELNNYNIKNYWIDLNELVGIDHVILIAEYRSESGLKRELIDPSFSQFASQEHKKLVKLDTWPSEKIVNKDIVDDLIETGVTKLSDDRWNDYLSSFSSTPKNISLEELLRGKIDSKGK